MLKDPQKITLFRAAPDTVVLPAGTVLFREGDEGVVMYAIKRGSVKVMVGGRHVETIGRDEVFGEMALLEHRIRSATVVTLEETALVEIDEAEFFLLVRTHPRFALQLMRVLSERLRHSHQHALNQVKGED
jgi:CRP/FNR family cyclic AMP-dependent transcriptional regulator